MVPGKANKEQQQKWLAKYEKLRQELPVDETICFMDGVHPTHNVQPAYGWIKKGVRKEIPANTGRERLNLSGIIGVVSHNIVIQEDQTLNAESTICFSKKSRKRTRINAKFTYFVTMHRIIEIRQLNSRPLSNLRVRRF